MRISNTLSAIGISISALALSAPAQAALTIDFAEVGADVVVTTNGSIDLTGLNFVSSFFAPFANVEPSAAYFFSAGGGVEVYTGLTGPAAFGQNQGQASFLWSGDAIHINGALGYVGVPLGYTSGAPLSATATFEDSTFASLKLWSGVYEFTLPNDTITLTIPSAQTGAVPEPATWAMMLLGFFALGGMMRSARRPRVRARA